MIRKSDAVSISRATRGSRSIEISVPGAFTAVRFFRPKKKPRASAADRGRPSLFNTIDEDRRERHDHINRSGRSTYPGNNSVLTSGATPVVSNEGMVGVSAWLGISTNLSQVVVQSPGSLLRITAEAFCHYLDANEVATKLMNRFIAYSLRSGYQTAVCNANHSIEQRSCRWILSTEDRVGRGELVLSQSLLAHMLGVRRQSVGEVAVRLQQAGLIAYRRTRLRITNRSGLESRSCECYQVVQRAYRTIVGSVIAGSSVSASRRS